MKICQPRPPPPSPLSPLSPLSPPARPRKPRFRPLPPPGAAAGAGDLETAVMDLEQGGRRDADCLVGSDLTLNCRRKSLYLSLQI